MFRKSIRIAFFSASLLAFGTAGVRADAVDFEKQIRPIFAQSCYKCHAGDKHKGGLSLDNAAAILKGGKDDVSVTPGDLTKSDLYARITAAKDDDSRMPPKGDMLSKTQTDLVKQWILAGAKFGDWKQDTPAAIASATAGGTSATFVEPQLPKVAPAPADAIKALSNAGAQALPVAQNTNFLDVGFQIGGSKIDDTQLGLLAPVAQQVYWLNLANTKISDAGLAKLEPLCNLTKLHLENTHITDAGLAHLKQLDNLIYLNLYGTGVSDAGLENLRGLHHLKTLYLWQTKVTPAGAESLKKALPGVTINIGWDAGSAVVTTPPTGQSATTK